MEKVMIVDDERDIAEMLQLMLKKEGFKTRTAEDGKDFLKKIDRFTPEEKTQISTMGNIVDYLIKPFEYDKVLNAVKK